MSNQSLLPIEKGYPERLYVPEELTTWEVEWNDYSFAPIYARNNNLIELLAEKEIVVAGEDDVRALATLDTPRAIEEFGPGIAQIRNPLGRTGINGSGIFYHAGDAPAADMAIVRNEIDSGAQVLLVFSNRRWGLPGGFCEPGEENDRNLTAVREAYEETGLDLASLNLKVPIKTLVEVSVKPNSKRSCDYGFISTQVELALLEDDNDLSGLKAGDDAENIGWYSEKDVQDLAKNKQISKDHLAYALAALAAGQVK